VDSLDVKSVAFGTPSASALRILLTLKNLQALPPVGVTTGTSYFMKWTQGGTIYAVRASSNAPDVQTYDAGRFVAGKYTSRGQVSGLFTAGPNGTIAFTVPRNLMGSPGNGTTLSKPAAETHGTLSVAGSGLTYTATTDLAPNAGGGASYVVGQTCARTAGAVPPPRGVPGSSSTTSSSPSSSSPASPSTSSSVARSPGTASRALPNTGVDLRIPVLGALLLLLAGVLRRRPGRL